MEKQCSYKFMHCDEIRLISVIGNDYYNGKGSMVISAAIRLFIKSKD